MHSREFPGLLGATSAEESTVVAGEDVKVVGWEDGAARIIAREAGIEGPWGNTKQGRQERARVTGGGKEAPSRAGGRSSLSTTERCGPRWYIHCIVYDIQEGQVALLQALIVPCRHSTKP